MVKESFGSLGHNLVNLAIILDSPVPIGIDLEPTLSPIKLTDRLRILLNPSQHPLMSLHIIRSHRPPNPHPPRNRIQIFPSLNLSHSNGHARHRLQNACLKRINLIDNLTAQIVCIDGHVR